MPLGPLGAHFQNKPRNGSFNNSPPFLLCSRFLLVFFCLLPGCTKSAHLLCVPFLKQPEHICRALSCLLCLPLSSPPSFLFPVNIQYVHLFKRTKLPPTPYSPLATPFSSTGENQAPRQRLSTLPYFPFQCSLSGLHPYSFRERLLPRSLKKET